LSRDEGGGRCRRWPRDSITPQPQGGDEILKKISLILSVLATFGFAVAISSPADAKPVNKTVHVNKTVNVHRNLRVNRTVNVNRNIRVNNRHRWHGRWYDYGVGPCWINVDGEWFWNILACPI
jgi:hypothetical protein